MLKLTDVKKKYGNFQLECSMEILEGRITGLIGENGAGKSTTLKAVLNLIEIDSGKIELFGKAHKELTPAEKEDIAVVFPDSGFSEYFNGKDILAMQKQFYKKFDENVFRQLCDQFQISLDKRMKEYSTGMRAKLKLAVALSHEAKLLILDEPTVGMDVVTRDCVTELLQEYMEKHTDAAICISSHISSDLEKLCDDIYMIHEGKMILHEETDRLLDHYGVLKVDEEKYASIDRQYLLRQRKESYGYSFLTDQRQFYKENYPDIIVEKGSIDDVILWMTKGERL